MKNPFLFLFRARDKPTDAVSAATTFSFGSSVSGKSVNARSAIQVSTVYACVRVIAETVASLPFAVFEADKSGSQKALDHPLYRILHDEPNSEMTSFIWREAMLTHLLLWGNSYCQILRAGRGNIVGLYPLLPDRMQSLPLEQKIIKSSLRIREWYEYWDGQVYVSFSGGKDSTVLLHLVRQQYPDVPAVFVDTGLEFPAIRHFVQTVDNVIWLHPKMRFQQIVQEYGYPVVSKDIARSAYYARKGSNWALKRFNGQNPDGSPSKWYATRQGKWKKLLDAPFKISDLCCHYMKEEPLKEIEKERKPFIGVMADESDRRESAYLKTGCNAFSSKKPSSKPMGFWKEQDVLLYIKTYDIPYVRDIYGEIVEKSSGQLTTTMETRTGCYVCPFGQSCRRAKGTETRYQRLKRLYPKQYEYCMRPLEENGLGMKPVLDFLEIPYE